MAFLIPFIPVVAAWVSAGFMMTTTVWVTLGMAVLSVGLSEYSRREASSLSRNLHLANTSSAADAVRVVYGETLTGGTVVYMAETSSNSTLHIVLSLCEGEIDSVGQVYLDGNAIEDYGDEAYYEAFSGALDQGVCETLHNRVPEWDDALAGTAYLYVRLRYRAEDFPSGVPVVTAMVRGRKVYDPRSGATGYSANAALCYYDYMRSTRYGAGIGSDFWDENSIRDAASWCDEMAFEFNGALVDQRTVRDTSETLLACFRAAAIWSQGVYRLVPLDYDAPVMHLTEDHIVEDSMDFEVPSIQDLPNTVRVRYPSSEADYEVTDLMIYDAAAVATDNEYREHVLELPMVCTQEQATLVGTYQLERARLATTYSFACGAVALPLEPGDIVEVSFARLGWDQRRVRIVSTTVDGEGHVMLSAIEEVEALYDDTVNVTTHTPVTISLPAAWQVPDEATMLTFAEEEYIEKGVSYTKLLISFTAPESPFWSRSEAWIKVGASGTWTHWGDVAGPFEVYPAQEGSTYYVRLVSVSRAGAKMAWADCTEWSYLVEGRNVAPGTVLGLRATVHVSAVSLKWDPSDDTDLDGYLIRKGPAWSTAAPVAFTRATQYSIDGLPKGNHTFWVRARDTRGVLSLVGSPVSVYVPGPPTYVVKRTDTATYNHANDVHDGTEAYSHPTEGTVLRVARGAGGDNLTGTYTSRVMDRGSIVLWRISISAPLIYEGTGVTWEDQIAAGETWAEAFGAAETWADKWGSFESGSVEIAVLYSDDQTSWERVDGLEARVAEVEARYLKLEITITDAHVDGRIMVDMATITEEWI